MMHTGFARYALLLQWDSAVQQGRFFGSGKVKDMQARIQADG
ncbi:hypothetical protein Barb4_01874 [Bacteroidales bacterium Barb4]|nr:hypothetical protein Barb4_01874 [Bacteroidales bacterium Barb4]